GSISGSSRTFINRMPHDGPYELEDMDVYVTVDCALSDDMANL
nr:hypothetical protein [Tanacetum cinerariifolium]